MAPLIAGRTAYQEIKVAAAADDAALRQTISNKRVSSSGREPTAFDIVDRVFLF